MKHTIMKGTLILSAAGILTRIIGFYYRIFLADTIGAEGVGLYQMIFPIYGLCISFSVMGIETAISKYTAERAAKGDVQGAFSILKSGLSLSLSLSIGASVVLFFFANPIAANILGDVRCADLLKLSAYAIPMCAIHGCIIGYFMGKRKTGIPALAQLMEQVCRVGSVFCIATVTLHQGYLSVNTAMAGLFAGEAASSLVCVLAVLYEYKKEKRNTLTPASVSKMRDRKLIFTMAYPLTLGRVITAVILSSEAVLILRGLKAYGLSHSESVRIYGILTGMSMPFIFFPSTITGAIASMILPSVSEAQSAGNYTKISKMTTLVVKYCFSIGIFFAALFYLYGLPIGTFFFHSQEAGVFISILSWLCPFMYLGATLTSILNGLGLTKITFFVNVGTAISRVAAIALLVPVFGIKGYLWGLLASHILTAALLLGFVKKYTRFHYSLRQCLLTPCIITLLSIVPCRLILVFSNSSMISLGCPVLLSCALFAGLLYYNSAIHNRDF